MKQFRHTNWDKKSCFITFKLFHAAKLLTQTQKMKFCFFKKANSVLII